MQKLTKEQIEQARNVSLAKVMGVPDSGRRITICCPFHNEKTGSCVLYPDNSFFCFGCNAKGKNSIDFLMLTGMSFQQTVDELLALC